MITIFEGTYQKLAPSCDFVSILCRNPMAIEGGDVKGVTFLGPISVRKMETSLSKLMKFIKVYLSSASIYTEIFSTSSSFIVG